MVRTIMRCLLCQARKLEDTGATVDGPLENHQRLHSSSVHEGTQRRLGLQKTGKEVQRTPVPNVVYSYTRRHTQNESPAQELKATHKDLDGSTMLPNASEKLVARCQSDVASSLTLENQNPSDSSKKTTTFYAVERRRSKRFHNIHPAQAAIKAKLDIFEGRVSLDSSLKAPSPTDLTESETVEEDDMLAASRTVTDARRRSSLGELVVKDCQHDPYQYAYKIWYDKGLLCFRPKGISAAAES